MKAGKTYYHFYNNRKKVLRTREIINGILQLRRNSSTKKANDLSKIIRKAAISRKKLNCHRKAKFI